MILLSITLLPN